MNSIENKINLAETKLRSDRKSLRIQIGVALLNTLVLIFDISTNNHTMWSGFGIGGMTISLIWCLFVLIEFYGDYSMSRKHLDILKALEVLKAKQNQ